MESSAASASLATPSPHDPRVPRNLSTGHFYNKSWGKAWPTVRKSLYLSTPEGDALNADSEAESDGGDKVLFPRRHEYVCFEDLDLLENTLLLFGLLPPVFVRLESYNTLVEIMENYFYYNGSNGFVLTGQSGIGKRTFLLYLLLHRLENHQPTAFQFHPFYYVLFDHAGWSLCHISQHEKRLQACWVLTHVPPCETLRRYSPCIVQATSSSPEQWKPWTKRIQHTRTLVMNLPQEIEITAIVKEHGYSSFAHRVPSMVRKWGPSLAMMLDFARAFKNNQLSVVEEKHEQAAINVANRISRDVKHLHSSLWPGRYKMTSGSFPLLFVCPASTTNLDLWGHCIPTTYMQTILEVACSGVSNELTINLFIGLSRRALARSMDDFNLELRTHLRLCTGNDGLRIFNGLYTRKLQPSSVLLPGTLDVNRFAPEGVSQPFYWIPGVTEFPGIDSVFGDNAGNLYAFQVSAKGDHLKPVDGLSKLWKSVGEHVRQRWSWHMVLVTKSRARANESIESYSDGLEFGCTLHADVWAAVL
ncbi:hypothetical protein PENSPDRAFT_752962 [Peniophora sp. CONT]|nr:hypothetical protein PENSPDRAFT_752962 [Peniophora sp. CONT]